MQIKQFKKATVPSKAGERLVIGKSLDMPINARRVCRLGQKGKDECASAA